MKTMLKLCALSLSVVGCASQGPDQIVSARGREPLTGGGTVEVFRQAFEASYKNATTPNAPPDPRLAAYMVRVGSELQYQLCKDFFRGAGKEQQWLLFGKDFLAVAGTIATGVLGAVSAASGGTGNATAIAWTGLGTAGGVSAINLYARNFLFSEENVGAVQKLTLDAVATARTAALSEERLTAYDFSSGISALIDVQAQCEVHNILNLVRESIGVARPYAVQDIETAADALVQSAISDLVNKGYPISYEQLRALYWLLMVPSNNDQKNELYNLLSALAVPPRLANNTVNQAFTGLEGRLKGILASLKASVSQQIRSEIEAAKKNTVPPANVSDGPAPAAAPASSRASAQFPPSQSSPAFGRITVKVR